MKTPQWALDKIKEAKKEQLKVLNLDGWEKDGELTQIPAEVFELEQLEVLNLAGNRLISVPNSICQLKNLTSLNLSSNHLTTVPDSISQLQNLVYLTLWDNRLTEILDSIYELSSLESLYLHYRGYEKSGKNQIKEISPKILQLKNLKELNLTGNPIETPPPEVVFGRDGKTNLGAIKNYFRQLKIEDKDYLYEAKLIIVGEAGAGKTSLAKKIKDQDYQCKEREPSTEGIDVIQWEFPLPPDLEDSKNLRGLGRKFRVNIWDFGGQEIYHATHQFFLTKRSLYALVVDSRKEDTDFYYWFNVVEMFSDNSPLLLIKNEKQNRQREINERQLRGEFTNLEKTLATNLKTNRGFSKILSEIKHYIGLNDYLKICEQNGFKLQKDKRLLARFRRLSPFSG